jgi:hypothetical protein
MKKQCLTGLSIWVGAATLLTGCYVNTFDEPADYDEIATVYDPDYDFTHNKTYAMPERIFDLSNFVEDSVPMDFEHEDVILKEIADQMADLGYDRVADPRSPDADVVLAVGAVTEENWVYGYYYYYDYYYYYPPVSVSVDYEVGTVIISMLNPKNVNEDMNTIPVVWVAGLRGFVDYYRSESEVQSAVAQAFKQSSYLKVGKPVKSEPGLEAPEGDAGDDADAGDDSDTGGAK